MQNLSKIKTYIGFSVKSGKIIYGADTLIETKKRVKLIIVCKTLAKSTCEKVQEYASSKGIQVLSFDECLLEDIVNKKNCKVIGLLNKNLAQAIIDSAQ